MTTPYKESYSPTELLPKLNEDIEVQIKGQDDTWFKAVREASNYWLVFDDKSPPLFDSYIVAWRPKKA